MQISAMSSAVVGMRRAAALQDEAAERIARDSGDAVGAVVPLSSRPPPDDGGLVTAVPDLLLSKALFRANAMVARTAFEAYRAALLVAEPRA